MDPEPSVPASSLPPWRWAPASPGPSRNRTLPPRRWWARLLLLLCGSAAALALVELFLHVHNPFHFRVKGDKIVLPSNVTYRFHNDRSDKLPRHIVHTKNVLGFRGDDPPKESHRYLTIVTVGGSTTECLFLSDGQDWTHALGVKLKPRFANLWINNAGLNGHSTFGHIVLMEDYLTKLKPRLVVFLVGANDVGTDDFNSYDKKKMKILNGESVGSFFLSLANYSEGLAVALNIYRTMKAKSQGLTDDTVFDLTVARHFHVSAAARDRILRSYGQAVLAGYERRLTRLIQLSRENGIEPVLVTQPALFGDAIDDVTHVDLATVQVDNDKNGALWWEILERYNDVTRRVARNRNVPLVDLATTLPKSSKYFYDMFHYTPEGAREVASIVATHLEPFLTGTMRN